MGWWTFDELNGLRRLIIQGLVPLLISRGCQLR